MQREYYHVIVKEIAHEAPGEDPYSKIVAVDEKVDTVEEALEVVDDHVPVSLNSGEPMHYEHSGGIDEFDTGRIYHYWQSQYGGGNIWIDACASIEHVTREFVKWPEITDVEPDFQQPVET